MFVKTSVFQSILDSTATVFESASQAAARQVVDFLPIDIPVRGKWLWHMISFDQLAEAPVLRQIQLASANQSRVAFVYR